MKLVLKLFKRLAILLLIIIVSLAVVGYLFMSFSPQFGGEISAEQMEKFDKLPHHQDGIFINAEPFKIKTDCHSIEEMIKKALNPDEHIAPSKNIEVIPFDVKQINQNLGNKARVVWLGHSSFLLEIEGKTILIDPVFSDFAAPHRLLGRKRYNNKMSFDVSDLERVDAVIISHDHYDHLDYETIKKIKDKIEHVIVPLGVGNHFKKWGVDANKVQELDWWDETELGSLKIALTPSRHASGRGLSDQSATLWGSWCFIGPNQRIFFSGDGGYGSHFKDIGAKYGPFDFGMIECGQYDQLWAGMHMMPEQSAQAGVDLQAKVFMPIHWGSFTLANHSWTDPIERFSKKAQELNATITTPKIGEQVLVSSSTYPNSSWWKAFD